MKKTILTLASTFFGLALFAQVSAIEKQSLIDFYESTNGAKWVNTWHINEPVNSWYGITVENDHVVGISMLFNNVDGEIPNSIANLEYLKVLELSFNKISGTIPSEIGQLSNLKLLALNGNDIKGSIPNTIGDLISLKELHLSSNNLQGNIPVSIINLENLEVLNVFDNKLTGTMPIGLQNSTNLKKLIIAKNNIIETDAYTSVLLFNNDTNYETSVNLSTSSKTVIATEISDDN